MSGNTSEVDETDATQLAEQAAALYFSRASNYQRSEIGGDLQTLTDTMSAGEYGSSSDSSSVHWSNSQAVGAVEASVAPTTILIEHEQASKGKTPGIGIEEHLPLSLMHEAGDPPGTSSADTAAADAAAAEERANYLAWERSVARGGGDDDSDDEEERRLWHDSDDDRDGSRASSTMAASTFAGGAVPSWPLSSGNSESSDDLRRAPPNHSNLAQREGSHDNTLVALLAEAAPEAEPGHFNRERLNGEGMGHSSPSRDDLRSQPTTATSSTVPAQQEQLQATLFAQSAFSARADAATDGRNSSSSSSTFRNANNYGSASPGWVVQNGGASPYFPEGPYAPENNGNVRQMQGPSGRWSTASSSRPPSRQQQQQQQQQPALMAYPKAIRAGGRSSRSSPSSTNGAAGNDEVKCLEERQKRDTQALRDLQLEVERLQVERRTPQNFESNFSGGSRSCPPQIVSSIPRGAAMKALDTVGGGMRDKGWAEDQDNDDVYRVRSLRVEGSEERGPRDEVSDGSRPQAYVHVSRAEWDHLRAAASERAVLSHEKEDLEQQLVALAENLTTAKATARKAEGNAKHLQACLGSTSEEFEYYRAQVSWQHEQRASAAKARGLRAACADPLIQEGAMASFQKQQRVLELALDEAHTKAARDAKRRTRLEARLRVSESRCRQLELLCADVLREVVQDAPQLRWHARTAYEALRQVVMTSPQPLPLSADTTTNATPPQGPRGSRGDGTSLNASLSASSSAASSAFGLGYEYSTSRRRRRGSFRPESAVHSSAPAPELEGSFVDQSGHSGADFLRSWNASSQRLHPPPLHPSSRSFSGSHRQRRGIGTGLSASWGDGYGGDNGYDDDDDEDDEYDDYAGMEAEAADAEVARETAANQRALKADLDATKLQLATETKRADALTLENKRLAQLCQEYASQYTTSCFTVQPLQKSCA